MLLGPSLDTPQFNSRVHASGGNHSALRVKRHTHNLCSVSSEGVETLASLTAPQLQQNNNNHNNNSAYKQSIRRFKNLLGKFCQKSQLQSYPYVRDDKNISNDHNSLRLHSPVRVVKGDGVDDVPVSLECEQLLP